MAPTHRGAFQTLRAPTAGELMFAVALIAVIYTRLAAYGAAGLLTNSRHVSQSASISSNLSLSF